MDNDKKMDEILNNTRHMKATLDSIIAFVNSSVIIVIIVMYIKRIACK